jgi:S-DNA-T family DNA segregation ATPase FtsK/SpoIIIE
MSDLMLVAGKEIENYIQKLSQMARAAGIHIIMATQRPSVDVITGTIKANFPTRISFQVSSKIDSRTILGEQGAEQLLGKGDMLFMSSANRIVRIHGPYVSEQEIERITNSIRAQGEPDYIEEITVQESVETSNIQGGDSDEDELYNQAIEIIKREGKASTSFLQRKLQIGYNRAARIIDMMEEKGLVSKANHVGKREVL